MLSPQDLSSLYQIISDDNHTFESISETFNKHFDKSNQLKAGTVLSILLKDNLLNTVQKIISYFILYTFTEDKKIDTNPFLPIILEIIQNTKNKIEQNFLCDFLYNQIDYIKTPVKNYINDNSKESKLNLNQIRIFSEKYYKEVLNRNNLDNNLNDNMRHVVFDRKKNDIKKLDNYPINDFTGNIREDLNLNSFQPNYMSYCPALDESNKLFDNEPVWIIPELKHQFIWESNIK